MNPATLSAHHHVAIIYLFFPHYRKAVFDELISSDVKFTLFGESVEKYEGIPAMPIGQEVDFRSTRAFFLKKYVFQWSAIKASLSGEFDTLVFVANPNFISTWIAAIVGRFLGKRIIFWGHGFTSPRKNIRNFIRKFFFSLAHAHYLYGYRAKVIAKNFGFKAENLYVGFNSLDYNSQIQHRDRLQALNISNSSPNIINLVGISRLTPLCQYDLLIEAVNIVQRKGYAEISLTIIGNGPSSTELQNLAKKLKVNAEFLGELYDEALISEYIYKADAVVSPGKVGLTAMHSLMFGTPIITHSNLERQMPEVEAVIEGISGFLFEYGNVRDLARCLIAVSKWKEDRSKTREKCFKIIDEIYNPRNQRNIMLDAIRAIPAKEGDDLTVILSERKGI